MLFLAIKRAPSPPPPAPVVVKPKGQMIALTNHTKAGKVNQAVSTGIQSAFSVL